MKRQTLRWCGTYGYEVCGGYPGDVLGAKGKNGTARELGSSKLETAKYEALLRGGEQVISVLEEMIVLIYTVCRGCPLLLQLPDGGISKTNSLISPMCEGVQTWRKDSESKNPARHTTSYQVQSLPRMIIMDENGKQVNYSVEAAKLAQTNASLGVYDASICKRDP